MFGVNFVGMKREEVLLKGETFFIYPLDILTCTIVGTVDVARGDE